MKPLEYFGVASQQVTTHSAHVLKIEGWFLGGVADRYLQVHDSKVAPQAGAVPLRQWTMAQGAAFFFSFSAGELALTAGMFIAVSTTDGTYTLSTDLMDVNVDLTDPETPGGTTYVGDLTTGVSSLQVWADAAGPKKLMSLEIDGTGLGADARIQVFAHDNPVANDVPVIDIKIPAGKVLTGVNALRFGQGTDIQQMNKDSSIHVGCTVAISTTPGKLTLVAGTPVKIKAEYK